MGTIQPRVYEASTSASLVANGKNSRYQMVFHAQGYAAPGSALAAAKLLAPPTVIVDGWNLNARRNWQVDPVDGLGEWTITVDYKTEDKEDEDNKDIPNDDPGKISFSFSGGTTHISQAIEQDEYGVPGAVLPFRTVGLNINQNSDGEVEGLDIISGACSITIEKSFPSADITNAKLKEYLNYVGMTNSTTWRSLEPECVLLTGIDGTFNSEGSWPLTFTFEYMPPETYNADGVTIENIAGHRYVWLEYADPITDQGDQTEAKKPAVVQVAKVYDTFDFSALGID